MEQQKPISHIKAGLLISSFIILLSLIMTFIGRTGDPNGGWISYLIIIAGLVFFIQHYGKTMDNRLSFGELFQYGFKTTTIVTLVFVVFLLIISFTQPHIKQSVLDATREELEKRKDITDAQINQMLSMTNRFFWVIFIGTTMFFFVLIGAVGSLIGAAITKKRPTNSIEQTSH